MRHVLTDADLMAMATRWTDARYWRRVYARVAAADAARRERRERTEDIRRRQRAPTPFRRPFVRS